MSPDYLSDDTLDGAKFFFSLTRELQHTVSNHLLNLHPSASIQEDISRGSELIGSDFDDYDTMVSAIRHLIQLKESTGLTPEEITCKLQDQLRSRLNNEVTDATAIELFTGLLESCRNLFIAYEASVAVADRPLLLAYGNFQIDLRPIFPHPNAIDPIAILQMVTMKLTYTERGSFHHIFLALDSSDLDALEGQIQNIRNRLEQQRKASEGSSITIVGA